MRPLTAALATCVTLVLLGCSDPATRRGPKNPAYLVIRPVLEQGDTAHTQMSVFHDKEYYHDDAPLVTLAHLDWRNVGSKPSAADPEHHTLVTMLTVEGARLMKEWSTANRGKKLGVFVNTNLIKVWPVNAIIPGPELEIDGPFSENLIRHMVTVIKAGGSE